MIVYVCGEVDLFPLCYYDKDKTCEVQGKDEAISSRRELYFSIGLGIWEISFLL